MLTVWALDVCRRISYLSTYGLKAACEIAIAARTTLRMDMPKKPEKRPNTVACGNPQCSRRNLDLDSYRSSRPGEHVEQERIHWCAYPRIDGSVVFCTCAHYTIFYNPAFKSPPLGQ